MIAGAFEFLALAARHWKAIGLAALVAAVPLAYGLGHWRGDNAGYERARAESLRATFDQLKERGRTDAEIRDMGDAGLCRLLGGSLRDGTCR